MLGKIKQCQAPLLPDVTTILNEFGSVNRSIIQDDNRHFLERERKLLEVLKDEATGDVTRGCFEVKTIVTGE